MKKQTFLSLVVALVSVALVYPHVARSLPPRVKTEAELSVGVCFGIMIVGVGGGIIIGLKKMCNGINPKPDGHHTIPNPLSASMAPNFIAPGTNSASFNFDDAAAETWDVSDLATNQSWQGPDGLPYQFYFRYSFRTSTNLLNWETNSFTGYLSPTWSLTTLGTNAMLAPRPFQPVFDMTNGEKSFFFQPIQP